MSTGPPATVSEPSASVPETSKLELAVVKVKDAIAMLRNCAKEHFTLHATWKTHNESLVSRWIEKAENNVNRVNDVDAKSDDTDCCDENKHDDSDGNDAANDDDDQDVVDDVDDDDGDDDDDDGDDGDCDSSSCGDCEQSRAYDKTLYVFGVPVCKWSVRRK
jgi:hypothetical protein